MEDRGSSKPHLEATVTNPLGSPLRRLAFFGICLLAFSCSSLAAGPPAGESVQTKKPLTFKAFFHGVSIAAVRMAPDGNAVVIETVRRDFAHNRFRTDLWMYSVADHRLTPFTTSGHDFGPQWSPNGRWVAFLSDRAKHGPQIYVKSAQGGGADLLTYAGAGGVHTYAWAPDSETIYYAAKVPLTKAEKKAHEKKWHDVIRYVRDRRSDNLYEVRLPALSGFSTEAPKHSREGKLVARTQWRVQQIVVTPDGRTLIYNSCQRQGPIYITGTDAYKKHQIYVVDLAAPGHPIHQLLHDKAIAGGLRIAPGGKGLYFEANTNIPGPYADLSGRVFYEPLSGGMPTRLAPVYTGSFHQFVVTGQGTVIASGQYHVEVPLYQLTDNGYTELPSRPGEYQDLSMGRNSQRLAFVYSSLTTPSEVYLAADWRHPNEAVQITHFNANLADRALPRGHSIWWTADDGVRIQGMLIFPPGEFNAKHLPLFVLIHGGPEDADVNHWEADWYQWGSLAAAQGWLVFEPNYRGSSGYGDAFMSRIVPHIVSRPGKDILEGVHALIRAGYANPNHMAIGGYSYGGYMTDWLITQTTEFKAAVTGAGAIENTANWGNDDLSYDDTYYLGGLPWQNEKIYNQQAAIWQMYKVKTPTQIVFGLADHRVSTCEDYLLDRALRAVGVPTEMLMFPGEHHGLGKNPWHGRIKVREELKWIRKWTKANVKPVTG
jgi:dipeptidyl aminopeptidase/acylaminoacyl peptidase